MVGTFRPRPLSHREHPSEPPRRRSGTAGGGRGRGTLCGSRYRECSTWNTAPVIGDRAARETRRRTTPYKVGRYTAARDLLSRLLDGRSRRATVLAPSPFPARARQGRTLPTSRPRSRPTGAKEPPSARRSRRSRGRLRAVQQPPRKAASARRHRPPPDNAPPSRSAPHHHDDPKILSRVFRRHDIAHRM